MTGCRGNFFPKMISQSSRASPHLITRRGRIHIGSHPAPHVDSWTMCPDRLTGRGIVHTHAWGLEANGVPLIFTDQHQFQTRPIGVEVRQMHRISVPSAGGVKAFSIIINRHGLIHHFIPAIIIHITHAQGMSPHARKRRGILEGRIRNSRIKHPPTTELPPSPIPSHHHDTAINPSAHDHTGALTIEIGHTCHETITAIAV